jgi:GT2 family glycosyltransferase
MNTPDLSIVIVNWNTRDLLRQCLASLASAVGDLDYEVLVMDNDSVDGSLDMVTSGFPGVAAENTGGNLGFARANNLALPRTRGRHVLLLNPDTICPAGSLAALVAAAARHPGCGAVGPMLTEADGSPTISSGQFPRPRFHWLRPLSVLPLDRRWRTYASFTYVPEHGDPDRLVDYVAGACMLIPRDSLEAVGLLDEQFFLYFEETDWCLRAWRLERPIVLVPSVAVVHLEGRAAELVSRFSLAQLQQSYRQFLLKNHGPRAVMHARVAQAWEKGWQWLWHTVLAWQPRHRTLAARYGFELGLQLRHDIAPLPPTRAGGD